VYRPDSFQGLSNLHEENRERKLELDNLKEMPCNRLGWGKRRPLHYSLHHS